MAQKETSSALSVNAGVEQPENTNTDAVKRVRKLKKKKVSTQDIIDGIISGDRVMLGRAITLIESNLEEHQLQAEDILNACLEHSGKSVRIGITGVPGVGKSTFIEAFGSYLTSKGRKVAVLAIDPSSNRSKGSILGDKTRMESLSVDPNAFIRPSPSACTLGGVARKTRETMLLCEAAGFDTILVETVGVGQSEVAAHSMVDIFLLLMLAGAGDELQGIKRGIMEMGDLVAVTKADSGNEHFAENARQTYSNALHYMPKPQSGWTPQVVTCSSVTNTGIGEIWNYMQEYISDTTRNGYFEKKRLEQTHYWMNETLEDMLKDEFFSTPGMQDALKEFETLISQRKLSSFSAGRKLFELFKSRLA